MRGLAIAVALAVGAALPLAAQDTPEEAMVRFQETLRAGDFEANAALMDPEALNELVSSLTLMARLAEEGDDAEELHAMFGVRSAEELEALGPVGVYARLLRGTLGADELSGFLASMEMEVIGSVPEGERHAHVVYRMRMDVGGIPVEQVQVAPMVRTSGGWRVMLRGSLAAMLQGMAAP